LREGTEKSAISPSQEGRKLGKTKRKRSLLGDGECNESPWYFLVLGREKSHGHSLKEGKIQGRKERSPKEKPSLRTSKKKKMAESIFQGKHPYQKAESSRDGKG